jgi:homoserine dehydrogenase
MKSVRVGLLGFGVVGSGVVKVLQQNAELISQRTGVKLELAAIADLDLKSDRGVKVDKKILTNDGFAVCSDPKIDVIVELVGGTGVAAKFIETALQNGKHVVTANKALLSEKGEALFQLAEKQGKLLLFEAAVGGAIPVVRTIKEDLAGEKIEKIYGILNGTCNYILSKLSKGGVEFADVLKEAQAKGYAEANPTLDIEGGDTAHKIALLAMLAWGAKVDFKQIHVEGITKLAASDFEFAKRLDRVIKLIAVAKKENGAIEIRVNPTLLPADSALAKIGGVTNGIAIYGKSLGEILLSGPGAGSLPTATAVVGDLVEVARVVACNCGCACQCSGAPIRGVQPKQLKAYPIKKIDEIESEYYLRFNVKDQPGVIRDISGVLAKYKLNVRDIFQLDLQEFKKDVPLAIILHRAKEADLRKAVAELDKLSCVKGRTVVIRVEE